MQTNNILGFNTLVKLSVYCEVGIEIEQKQSKYIKPGLKLM